MGLSGPRKRAKISKDPNNTSWSRNTTGFGHNLLLSQGWNPGDNLGAKDAHHAHLHSVASSSHIRVNLKDDNLGLGAKRGQAAGECTGLDVFQNLLGRLNGKSEVLLKKEQSSRDDVKRVLYADRRWGSMRFVNGGILVGDQIRGLVKAEEETRCGAVKTELDKKLEEGRKDTVALDLEVRIKSKSPEPGQADLEKIKKERRRRKREAGVAVKAEVGKETDITALGVEDEPAPEDEDAEETPRAARKEKKARRKAEKAQRKLARTMKRAAKAAAVSEAGVVVAVADPGLMSVGRHAVRQRFIRQKRMATMDPKALNEILMIKAR